MDISATVCLFFCNFLCVFVRLRITLPRIKLAASNFAGRFIGVQFRGCHIFGNFSSPEAQNQTNRLARSCCNVMLLGFCDSHSYQVRAACGRRVSMCGYMSVPKDGRTCCLLWHRMARIANLLDLRN